MSLSRSFNLLKNVKNSQIFKSQVRHSGHGDEPWMYRKSCANLVPRHSYIMADGMIAFATWWIVWHIWHEPGHIVGEFEYPDPSKWTDAELGIPPDDEE